MTTTENKLKEFHSNTDKWENRSLGADANHVELSPLSDDIELLKYINSDKFYDDSELWENGTYGRDEIYAKKSKMPYGLMKLLGKTELSEVEYYNDK